VRFSRGAKASIAAILLLSLAAKLIFSHAAAPPGGEAFGERTSRLLRAEGYATSFDDRPFGRIIHAVRPRCRLIVAEYPAHGTLAAPLAALAEPLGRLRFAWRGATYDEAPKLLPLVDFYVRRELRRAGFSPQHAPIIAFAGSRDCGSEAVPWEALAALPG
jgi:hypothetical protein